MQQKEYEQAIEIRNLKEQLDMQKADFQEEREATKAELMAMKAEVNGLKELMKQFMESQAGTSK